MISSDIQSLEPGNIVALYELDLTTLGGSILRYHAHSEQEIVWQGNTYIAWPIKAEGFARKGTGSQARPKITVGNIGLDSEGRNIPGVISSLCLEFDDLVGTKMTLRRTFTKYLDAVNFPDGNPSADPSEHFPDEIWRVEQKSSETPEQVEFVLSSPIDFNGKQVPDIQILATICPWVLKGLYRQNPCNYTGSAMFTKDDVPTTDPTLDRCGGRVKSCKIRFAAQQGVSEDWAIINTGAFPSAGRLR